jgi:DNA-binding transcriptional regulator YhcF (GntR family)
MTDISLKKLQALLARDSRGAASGPKYMQVCDAFAAAIRRGEFKPGQRIPSESELYSRLPVSLGTLQKAMGKLAAAGLIVRNKRTGTFVAERKSQASEAFVYRFRDPASGRLQLPFVRVLAVQEDRTSSTGRCCSTCRSRSCMAPPPIASWSTSSICQPCASNTASAVASLRRRLVATCGLPPARSERCGT